MFEYDENGIEKPKFKVGELVRASSCLNRSCYTKWDPSSDYRPWGKVRINGQRRVAWRHNDVGIVTRVEKPTSCQNYYVEVHFVQSGDRVILTQRELKWAAK